MPRLGSLQVTVWSETGLGLNTSRETNTPPFVPAMATTLPATLTSATRCQFRLIAPLFEQQGLIAGADYVRDRGGRRTAQGTVA